MLVDVELGGDTLMPYGIMSIVDATGYGLITDIDGITACLGNGGQIGGDTFVMTVLDRLYLAHGTGQERILSVEIETVVESEACGVGFLPIVCAMRFLINTSVTFGCVVIDNHLTALPVALTGCEHNGTGTFQHRNQIRNDNGLGEQILTCSEEWGTLPFPSAVGDMEIDAVTRPYTKVAVLKTVGNGIGQGGILYPGLSLITDVAPDTGRVGGAQKSRGNQLPQFPAACLYRQLVVLTTVGHQALYIIIYMLHRFGCETDLAEMRIGTYLDRAQGVVDLKTLQMGARADALSRGAIPFEVIF